MELTRRMFGKSIGTLGLVAALGNIITSTACGLFDSILAYVGVGLQAFGSVVDLLAGAGVIPPGEGTLLHLAINAVKVGFADVQAAVTAYDNAPPDQKGTLKGKISVVLAILEADIQKFWDDLKIPDSKLASLVQGLLGIILSTLAAFQTQLPAPPKLAKVEASKNFSRRIVYTPKKRSVKDMRKDFNQLLHENGYTQHTI